MKNKTEFEKILAWIEESYDKTIQTVNKDLITLYWKIGQHIHGKIKSDGWGKSTIDNLALFIKQEIPTLKGFTARNLRRMRQFYETYYQFPNLSPLVTNLNRMNWIRTIRSNPFNQFNLCPIITKSKIRN